MLPSTQREILKATNRAWSDLGRVLGRESFGHAEGIQFFRAWFGEEKIPVAWILKTDFAVILPAGAEAAVADPRQFDEFLVAIDTEAKFGAYLLNCPEPDAQAIGPLVELLNSALIQFGEILASKAKLFPSHRGGRPKKIPSADEQIAILDEIKTLRNPGTKLHDIFARIGQRHGVSTTTIKRIWATSRKG